MIRQFKRAYQEYGLNPPVWFRNWRWRARKSISDLKVVFIVGCPRSGTTLTQKTIESHSHCFAYQGESGMFTNQNIFRLNRKHFGLEGNELRKALSKADNVVDFFDQQVRRLNKELPGEIYVDKTGHHILKLDFILRSFPNARVIHIVRDGRDSYCSALGHDGVPQRDSVLAFAKYWTNAVDTGLDAEKDQRVFHFRYEDFTRNPIPELKKIMNHIGLEAEDSQIDPTSWADDSRARMKEFNKLQGPVTTSSIERWRTQLSSEEIADFNAIAGETLRRLGYSTEK